MQKNILRIVAVAAITTSVLTSAASAQVITEAATVAETLPRQPTSEQQSRRDQFRAQRDARLADMNPTDRAAAEARIAERKSKFEAMTPEQRQAKMQERQSRRGEAGQGGSGRRGEGRPQRRSGLGGN